MSSFGQKLRQAREACGLTCSQVAEQTHILVQTITDMENEDFHSIPAPIYGRGFVRLFAETVGLDPQPLVREFMDIYEGRRAQTVVVQPVPPPPPAPAPEVPAAPLAQPEEPAAEPVDEPTAEPTVAVDEPSAAVEAPPVLSELETAVGETFANLPPPQIVSIRPSDEVPPVVPPAPAVADPATPPAAAPAEESPAAEPPAKLPPVLNGLDLFEQAAAVDAPARKPDPLDDLFPRQPPRPPAPKPVTQPAQPAYGAAESPYLPSDFSEQGPTALERFHSNLSSVSDLVLGNVRRIPRRFWRQVLLLAGALLVIAAIAFGCYKLYQMTSPAQPGSDPQPAAPATVQPPTPKPAPAAPARATARPKPQPAPATPSRASARTTQPKKPARLQSTGQKIPPLYVD